MSIRITNMPRFQKNLKKFIQLSGANTNEVATKVALDAFKSVVEKTPVDTGWARANWNFAEGKPDLSEAKKPAKGRTLPPPDDPVPPAHVLLPVYYITNNISYIKYLEAGKNKHGNLKFKTPNTGRMVQRTLFEMTRWVKEAIRELRT